MGKYDRWARRNREGKEFEESGDVKSAVEIYLANVDEETDTSFTYRRLCIIFRRHWRYEEEVRIARLAQEHVSTRKADAFAERESGL